MAICNPLVGGITKGCDNNIGSISKLYITELENITAFTHNSPSNDITGITMSGNFYDFEFNRNTSNYVESTVFDPATGTELTTQTITLKLPRREQTKRDTLLLLGKGKPLAIIAKDGNGIYKLFGETGGCIRTTQEGGSGTAKTDANDYTITFVGEEPEEACDVDSTIIAALLP